MNSKNFYKEWEKILSSIMDWSDLGVERYDDGGLAVANIKTVAPRFYLHKIYPALSNNEVRDMEMTIGKSLPKIVKEFYSFSNGCRLYDTLNIYGSISKKNLVGQPISIRYGNLIERPKKLPKEAIVVGTHRLSNSKEKSYLCALSDDLIVATASREEFHPVYEWNNIFEMVNFELLKLFPLYSSLKE